MKPARAGEELVSQIVSLEKAHKIKELAGVLGADVGSLALQVLRALDATNEAVDAGVALAGVDEDRADHLSSGLQEHQTAIG